MRRRWVSREGAATTAVVLCAAAGQWSCGELSRWLDRGPSLAECPSVHEVRAEPAVGAATESAQRWTSVVACGARPGPPLRGPARWLFGDRIDPNTASPELLDVLPGIGPARATAIAEARRHAPFERVEDLARIHGIGPATTRRIAPWISIRRPIEPSPPGRSRNLRGGGVVK